MAQTLAQQDELEEYVPLVFVDEDGPQDVMS